MKIKQLSNQLNISQKTIRYYEQCGLITPTKELKMGREFRDYEEETVERLKAIVVLRKLRFSIEEIQRIFDEPDAITEICECHRQQMSEELAFMTDACTLLEEVSQLEIEDGQGLSTELERRRKEMLLERCLDSDDLSKYDGVFMDYDLLEEKKVAEWNARMMLVTNLTNNKTVLHQPGSNDKEGRKLAKLVFSMMVLLFFALLLLEGGRSGGSETGPIVTEAPIVLSADNVSVTEEDYQILERQRALVRELLLEHPDADSLQSLKDTFNLNRLMGADTTSIMEVKEWNVSCIPLLGWNYFRNTPYIIPESGVLVFDDEQKYTNLVFIEWNDEGESGQADAQASQSLKFEGSKTMDYDLLREHAEQRFLWIQADIYSTCFIGEDNVAYNGFNEREHAVIHGDLAGKFDWDRITVNYKEMMDSDNCIKIRYDD